MRLSAAAELVKDLAGQACGGAVWPPGRWVTRAQCRLLEMVEAGTVDPERMVTQHEPLRDVLEAYKQFDLRSPSWLKVALEPAS